MTGSVQNQTLTYLTQRFQEAGIRPQSRYGQNFLIDLNLLRLLLDAADLQPNDVVLEVGTGTGSLSVLMSPRVARIVTVEIDPCMAQLAGESLIDCPNVELLHFDALKNKNTLSPRLVASVQQALAETPGGRLKLVANLPYCVATPIISNLLLSENVPHSLTVTIQKELADRILAPPRSKDYSALSVWIQSVCRAKLIRLLPPTAFWPRPKVTSAILHLESSPELRARIPDLRFFHEFVRSLFFHRRKFLRSVVLSAFKGRLDKSQVDAVLQRQGVNETSRAEELSVERMLALCEALRAELPS